MSRRRALFPNEVFPQNSPRAAKRQGADTTDSKSSVHSAASSRCLKMARLAEEGVLQYRGKTFLKSSITVAHKVAITPHGSLRATGACLVANTPSGKARIIDNGSSKVERWLDIHHGQNPKQLVSPAPKQHLMKSLVPEPSEANYFEDIKVGQLNLVVAGCSNSQSNPLVMEEAAQSCSVGSPIRVCRLVDYEDEDSVGSSVSSDPYRLFENTDRIYSPKPLPPVPGPSIVYPDIEAVDDDRDCEADFNLVQARIPTVAEREIPSGNLLDPADELFIETLQERIDNEQDNLLGLDANFDWTEDFTTFRGVAEEFTGGKTGPTRPLLTPYEAFSAIWDEAIISVIVNETNRYAQNIIQKKTENGTYAAQSRMRKWVEVNAEEMMSLLSVFMLMGIYPLGRLDMYWKTKGPFQITGFREVMSFHRYVLLTKCLHFVDDSQQSSTDRKLFKLRPIIDHLNKKFQELYVMKRVISLDESLSLWKGFLAWVQTIRTKSARFGIKTFEVCEASTGYLWKFEVYTGKTEGGSEVSLSDALSGKNCKIVLELLKGLEHKGYCVVMDNFYNCPALARYLKSQGFDCLGTVRENRKHMPVAVKALKESVPKGTIVSRHSGDVSVVSWKDAKLVNIISTFHDNSTYVGRRAGKEQVKPLCVKDYNKGMGGVDVKDQKLSNYLLERKRGAKWNIKMFKRLTNVSVHNSYILHSASMVENGQHPLSHR